MKKKFCKNLLLFNIGPALLTLLLLQTEIKNATIFNSETATEFILRLNRFFTDEALSIEFSIPWILTAVTPGLIAVILSKCINEEEEKKKCLERIKKNDVTSNNLPESLDEKWIVSAAGVWGFYILSDVLLKKVGGSITSTVAGVSLFLFANDHSNFFIMIGGVFTMLALAYLQLIFRAAILTNEEPCITNDSQNKLSECISRRISAFLENLK